MLGRFPEGFQSPIGLRGVQGTYPIPFLAGSRKIRLNQALSVLCFILDLVSFECFFDVR